MREIEKFEGEMGQKSQRNVEERSVREAGEKWKMGEKSQGNVKERNMRETGDKCKGKM